MSIATMSDRGVVASAPRSDLTEFTGLIDTALTAFARDVSYAVSMARAAGVIQHKRAVWAARKQRATVDDFAAA